MSSTRMIRTFGLAGCLAGSAAKSTTGMTNISKARALIADSVSQTRKSRKKGEFTVIGKISPQDCGREEFSVHLIGKMPLERPPISSAKRAKCDDFSIDLSAPPRAQTGDARKSTARVRNFCGNSNRLVDLYHARHVFFHRDGQHPAFGTWGHLHWHIRDHLADGGFCLQTELRGIDLDLNRCGRVRPPDGQIDIFPFPKSLKLNGL